MPELLVKSNLCLNWHWVPIEYVSSDSIVPVFDKILPRLGTLNAGPFLGFRPGELLLMSVKAEEMVYPVTASDPTNLPLTGFTLSLVWELFRPKKGVPASPTPPSPPPGAPPPIVNEPYPYYGHRLFPWAGGTSGSNGLYYYCVRSDTQSEYLRLTDHWAVFSHQADPATSTDP